MWVARLIKEVKADQGGRGGISVEVKGGGRLAERHSGGGGATVGEGGVEVREAGGGGEEGKATGSDSSVGVGDAVPRDRERALVGEASDWPHPGKLATTERRQPSVHIVPHRCPAPIPRSVMIGDRGSGGADGVDTVAAKAAWQLNEAVRVEVSGEEGGRDGGEVGVDHKLLEGLEPVGDHARG